MQAVTRMWAARRPACRLGVRWFSAELEAIRNIGISAHIDSGKTTLTERILFYTGRIKEIHDVRGKDGVGAKMDHMELERERGITITSAATYCNWKVGDQLAHINIIDTPGHVDFTIEVERALRVLDGAVLVACGVGGVQAQTVTVDRQMKRYDVPRIIFVNKLDRYGANPFVVLSQIRQKLGLHAAALQIPIGEENKYAGVACVISRKAYLFDGEKGSSMRVDEVPAELKGQLEEVRNELIEHLADIDDEFAEAYLEGELTEQNFHDAIRRGVISLKFCPMLMGSAYKNKGVQNLLDAVVRYLPHPAEKRNIAFDLDNDEEEIEVQPADPKAPFVGLAFKIQEHPQCGQISYLRVYQGKLSKGDSIVNLGNNKRHTVRRLIRMHSNEIKDVETVGAGDIVAIGGFECESGTCFTDGKVKWAMASMYVPDPVVSLSVSCKGRDEMARFQKALKRFVKEDPTFRVHVDEETQETIVSGMGELHVEVYAERMRREYGLTITTGAPQVHFRETITERADFDYQYKRQSGGRGQYGKVIGYIEPIPEEDDKYMTNEFVNDLTGNDVPPNFHASIQKGFQEVSVNGQLSGHRLLGCRYVVTDGAAHEVDSSDIAFRLAAAGGFQQAFPKAQPIILEPIMKVEITVPSEFQAAGLQSLTHRRGSITNTMPIPGDAVTVEALVPLKDMFGYSNDLRSATQGQGEFVMSFEEYQPMTSDQQEVLVQKYKDKLAGREVEQ